MICDDHPYFQDLLALAVASLSLHAETESNKVSCHWEHPIPLEDLLGWWL